MLPRVRGKNFKLFRSQQAKKYCPRIYARVYLSAPQRKGLRSEMPISNWLFWNQVPERYVLYGVEFSLDGQNNPYKLPKTLPWLSSCTDSQRLLCTGSRSGCTSVTWLYLSNGSLESAKCVLGSSHTQRMHSTADGEATCRTTCKMESNAFGHPQMLYESLLC